jgi:hypothetical protein
VHCGCAIENKEEWVLVDQKNRWVEVEGMIVIADQDRRGKILEIALETRAFEMYLFTGRGKGRELSGFLNQKVRIEGRTEGKDYYGRNLITVETYQVCETVSSI